MRPSLTAAGSNRPSAPALLLAAVVGLLAGLAAGAGVLLRGDLATSPFTTLRGETIDAVTGGVYAWNALPVVSEGIGWDLVTLLLVVPAFVLALVLAARGSIRATLAALGFLAYFIYQYAEYAMFWAAGPLYPLHVVTFALAITAMVLLLADLDRAAVARRVDDRFPRRGVVALGMITIVVLFGLWLPTVFAVSVGGQVEDRLNGAQTLVVPAFDLGLLVPLAAFTVVLAWRRHPAGVVLGAILVVKAIAMPLAIVAMLVVEGITTGALQAAPIAMFVLVALFAAIVGVRLFGSIGGGSDPAVRLEPIAVG